MEQLVETGTNENENGMATPYSSASTWLPSRELWA